MLCQASKNDEELAKELEAGWRKPTPTNQAAPAKSGHVVVMVEVADDQVGELRWEDGWRHVVEDEVEVMEYNTYNY